MKLFCISPDLVTDVNDWVKFKTPTGSNRFSVAVSPDLLDNVKHRISDWFLQKSRRSKLTLAAFFSVASTQDLLCRLFPTAELKELCDKVSYKEMKVTQNS